MKLLISVEEKEDAAVILEGFDLIYHPIFQ